MSLLSQITQAWQQWRDRNRGAQTTNADLPQPKPSAGDELTRLSADQARQAVIKTCRRMYEEDPRADGVLHTLARDMVGAGLTVKTGNAAADQVAADLLTRIDLVSRLDDWIRLSARDGDSFFEVEVSAAREIVGVTRKPTLEMYRNSNQQDQFDDPTRAFWWSDAPYQVGLKPPSDALWFAEWQMIHARWSHDEGQRYGRPLFKSATGAWKRITEGELDVATRRKTRAGMKYNHLFPPGTSTAEIEAYKQVNADILNSPLAAIQDYFGTADLKTVEGDARLGEIEDILHHIRTWWVVSPVPMSLLGYGQDLNRDVLQEQKEQYDEALEELRPWVEKEILRPLFELAWLLAGILPDTLTVTYRWQAKRILKPVDLKDIAEAGIRLRALGLPDAAVLALMQRFLPDVEWDALMQPTGDGAEGTPATTADTADRMMARVNGA